MLVGNVVQGRVLGWGTEDERREPGRGCSVFWGAKVRAAEHWRILRKTFGAGLAKARVAVDVDDDVESKSALGAVRRDVYGGCAYPSPSARRPANRIRLAYAPAPERVTAYAYESIRYATAVSDAILPQHIALVRMPSPTKAADDDPEQTHMTRGPAQSARSPRASTSRCSRTFADGCSPRSPSALRLHSELTCIRTTLLAPALDQRLPSGFRLRQRPISRADEKAGLTDSYLLAKPLSRSTLRHHKKSTPIDFNPAQYQSYATPAQTTGIHHAQVSSPRPFPLPAVHISPFPFSCYCKDGPGAYARRLRPLGAMSSAASANARDSMPSRRPLSDVTYRDIRDIMHVLVARDTFPLLLRAPPDAPPPKSLQ
ncbi:hypothetical protein HYPSUDRAFT_196846 [Hypholoma sublateritium FD-334 SS-4]|uniref:Uncharacterized protein n=1 Tax=Hypholoma sublateritium (strain FD-334 SS-4) TaxID=945553 RepID=A0A0D2LN28_HYPSF|nr:hypothetical protein HYPSUDRAFT_196846 [Hypholoma sublateritium FD-334 SS-4]